MVRKKHLLARIEFLEVEISTLKARLEGYESIKDKVEYLFNQEESTKQSDEASKILNEWLYGDGGKK